MLLPRLSRTGRARLLTGIAAGSFLVMVAAYVAAPGDQRARAFVADVAWTWAAAYALVCCLIAWRGVDTTVERATWGWMAAGCASFLVGQVAWSADELWRGVRPPYPSLADIGFLGIYVCAAVAVLRLLRREQRQPADPEITLDVALVTFTAGALAYEFLLAPRLAVRQSVPALLTSVAWATGGIAVLWLLLVQLIRRGRFPFAGGRVVALGLSVFCVTNVVYAGVAIRGSFTSGGGLDLGWDAGLLLIAVAAARAIDQQPSVGPAAQGPGPSVLRLVAIVIGLTGLTIIAVSGALGRTPSLTTALLCGVAGCIVVLRFGVALRADRRYAALLEREVAAQTRSLMESLAATTAAERNLRLLMESVPDAVVVLDRSGRILEFNAPARELAAATPDRPPERSVFESLDGAAALQVRQHLDAALAGEVRRFEVPLPRPDGTAGISSVLYAPIREDGRVTKVLALARDVSDQRRTEAQLQQAEKLSAMGQLVSGVAHEINNPAAIISGFAQTLLLDALTAEQKEMITMIREEAIRIGRITSNLLAFARAGGRERALVDVNDLVRRTFALRSYHLSTLNITVSLELDPVDPKAWANGSELQQLLLNILINAEQALTTSSGRREITLRTRATPAEILIACADTGPGVPDEIREKIFDPFFTTKPEGVGTGLGLSICYGIARDHGGRIWVESEPGAGATFHLALPSDARALPREHRTTPPGQPQDARHLSVLLVDDEAGLRRAVAKFLGRRGIEVTAVGDGAEALAALQHKTYDVILSDVRMPGVGGREFLERLRVEFPAAVAHLVFSTGDTFAPDTAALLLEAGVPSLVKPFDLTHLEELVRSVAARTGSESPSATE